MDEEGVVQCTNHQELIFFLRELPELRERYRSYISYVARESQSIKNFFSIGIEKAMLGKYLVSTYCSLGSQAKRIQIETWNAELCHISC